MTKRLSVSIAEFGRTKRSLLERFLDLSAEIPSHDRFNAIFAMLKPAEFENHQAYGSA